MKTVKKFSNKVFVVALTALMAICLSCLIGLVHIAQAASTGIIGLGEDQKATVDVTSTEPATLTVAEDVQKGSYLFVAYVTNLSEDERWNVTFSLQSSETVYFIPYDSYIGGYTSVIEAAAGDTLRLSVSGEYDLTVEAHLETLSIGPANDYMLSGIQISKGNDAVINLLNVPADTYIVSAEIIADTAPAVEMTVSVDGSTPVNMTLNPNMYNAYTAPITVGMNSHSITLSTSYESTISINLNLYPEVETTALPTSTPDDFSAYEVKTYSYTAAKTGYQVLVPTATPSASSFSIVYKNSPNDFGGETLGENYPIYMEQSKVYYFTVSYLNDVADAHILFAVNEWTPDTLKLNSDVVYAPVSNTTVTGAIKYEVAEAGTYELDLLNIPYYNATITAHYGTNGTAILNSDNNFAVNVGLENASGDIYFTTDFNLSFTVGVALSYAQRVYDDRIPLDTNVEVELNPNESLVYVVGRMVEGTGDEEVFTGLTNGNYSIALTNANGQVVVNDANYSTPIVAAGGSSGIFAVLLDYPDEFGYNGETSRQQPIFIENIGDTLIKFTVRVTAYTTNTLELGVAKEITLSGNEMATYFIEGLTSGSYLITIGETHSTIVVYNMADRATPIVPLGANVGMYSFTLVPARENPEYPEFNFPGEESRTLAYMIENTGTSEQKFTVTVSKVDSLELDKAETITFTEGQSKTYYIGNLVSGTYNVEIEGDMVAVVANGATYSDGKLVVRASAGKYALVSLTFTSETAQTVTVTITETVDGTMTVGTPQSIALSYYDDTVSYSIELTPGVYRIDLSNVKHTGENEAYWMVSVNDNYIMFGTTSAIFEIAEEGIYTITFMYYDMDSVSFDATISLVPERMLVLGESKQITLAAESNENYYINLETGAYAITLTFTDGSQIQVLLNGGEIIGGGATSAEFVITSNGYYIFTFANLATANTTFSVVITVLE